MNFSWVDFLKQYGIHYVQTGPNVARDSVNIACPFCGNRDPSEHMGLKLNNREPWWGCWRDSAHRGKSPARLISALLDCSLRQAHEIIEASDESAIDDYEKIAMQLEQPPARSDHLDSAPSELLFPGDFRQLRTGEPGSGPFVRYLAERGFDHLDNLAWFYGMHYSLVGSFGQRLIIPFFFNGKLVGWTGRHIGKATLRYKTLSHKPETALKQGANAPAPMNPKAIVFNYDNAMHGGTTLFVCEGPMDAIKLDWYGGQDVSAIACLGMPVPRQLMVIAKLAQVYDQICVALDHTELLNADKLQEELQAVCPCPVMRVIMPKGIKDPGELRLNDVRRLLYELPKRRANETAWH